MKKLCILIFFFSFQVLAQENPRLCEYFNLPSCSGVSKQNRRNAANSIPSPSTAGNMNPANVSVDRGVGLEVLYQQHNSIGFNLAGGSGKMGGALISPTLENSFFGNRTPEVTEKLGARHVRGHRYDSQKYSFAFARKIIARPNAALDLGLSVKRHSLIGQINPGAGLSARLGPFTFGAAIYKDDIHLDYKNASNPYLGLGYPRPDAELTYEETFKVESYSGGLKIRGFSFDVGLIKSKYQIDHDNTRITIYSTSYSHRNFLFNLAWRTENSPRYAFVDDIMIVQRKKKDTYAGVQYSLNKHIILGLNYNYFLLRELSATSSFFF